VKGTSFSDKELEKWSQMKHAGRAREYWESDRYATCIGAPSVVSALSGEALEMRRILREFISRHNENTTDPLVLRAVELLGFNLNPQQPLFPTWPERST